VLSAIPLDLTVKKQPVQPSGEAFGQRLARIRKRIGFTQRELGEQIGLSQRMVAYYEGQTEYPPAHILPLLVEALGVSADELLGIKPEKQSPRGSNQRLWRRFKQIEKLPPRERKQLLGIIDAVLERHRLAQRDNAA
jgi:transcriptional regulator with XRE-family HTH domain